MSKMTFPSMACDGDLSVFFLPMFLFISSFSPSVSPDILIYLTPLSPFLICDLSGESSSRCSPALTVKETMNQRINQTFLCEP